MVGRKNGGGGGGGGFSKSARNHSVCALGVGRSAGESGGWKKRKRRKQGAKRFETLEGWFWQRGYIVVALSPQAAGPGDRRRVRWWPPRRGLRGAVEEEWVDGNCCFISDSANLARPPPSPVCFLITKERENKTRLVSKEKGGEMPDDGRVRRRKTSRKGEGRWRRQTEFNSAAHGIKIPSCSRVLCVPCNFPVNPTVLPFRVRAILPPPFDRYLDPFLFSLPDGEYRSPFASPLLFQRYFGNEGKFRNRKRFPLVKGQPVHCD